MINSYYNGELPVCILEKLSTQRRILTSQQRGLPTSEGRLPAEKSYRQERLIQYANIILHDGYT